MLGQAPDVSQSFQYAIGHDHKDYVPPMSKGRITPPARPAPDPLLARSLWHRYGMHDYHHSIAQHHQHTNTTLPKWGGYVVHSSSSISVHSNVATTTKTEARLEHFGIFSASEISRHPNLFSFLSC